MALRNALLVDDSKSARFMLSKILEKSNLKVDVAESGEEALTYLEKSRPDVIFMDHMMPGLNGLETAQKIIANPKTSHIPIVMCTSNEGQDYVQEVLGKGVAGILPKPATQPLVQSILKRLSGMSVTPAGLQAKEQSSTLTRDLVERIAQATAEHLVKQTVPELVQKLLDQELPEIREEMLKESSDRTEVVAMEHINKAAMDILDKSRQEAGMVGQRAAEEYAKIISEDVSRQIVQSELTLFTRETQKELTKELKEVRELAQRPNIIDQNQFQEVKAMAEDVARNMMKTANQMAEETAKDVAVQISQNHAKTVSQKVAEKVVAEQASVAVSDLINQFTNETQKAIKKAYTIAICSGALGILAAVAVYFLK